MALFLHFGPSKPLKQPKTPQILKQNFAKTTGLRCRAIKRQTKWSAPKLTNFEIDVGPSSGTLMKPKNHSMGVGGLLVRELEREKDLKAEKD